MHCQLFTPEQIKKILKGRNIREVSRKSGVPYQTLNNLLRGGNSRASTLDKLSKYIFPPAEDTRYTVYRERPKMLEDAGIIGPELYTPEQIRGLLKSRKLAVVAEASGVPYHTIIFLINGADSKASTLGKLTHYFNHEPFRVPSREELIPTAKELMAAAGTAND